jgi:hypothetical protein
LRDALFPLCISYEIFIEFLTFTYWNQIDIVNFFMCIKELFF